MGLLDFWTDTIGVDPGSQNLRIIKDGELVFNEKSRISFNKIDNVFSGLGNSIRTTPKDAIIKPVNYCIWDFHAFEMLLRSFQCESQFLYLLHSSRGQLRYR